MSLNPANGIEDFILGFGGLGSCGLYIELEHGSHKPSADIMKGSIALI